MKLMNYYIVTVFFILNCYFPACSAQWQYINKATTDVKDVVGTALEPLKSEFYKLSPKGRYATGVVAGYTSAKIAYKTTAKVVKYTGVAFIAAEIANQAGLLEDVQLSEENSKSLQLARQKVTETVNSCRLQVRKHVSIDNMRSLFDRTMEKDTMGTLGFATGAVAGLVW